MIKAVGNFLYAGLKEAGICAFGGFMLIAIVAFVMGPFFGLAHLGDIWHPAWAFVGWAAWFIVLCGIGKKMGW